MVSRRIRGHAGRDITVMQEVDRGAVRGTFDPRFEAVVDAFSRNFTEHGEVGGACALYTHGRCVVDLWGGIADPVNGRPWQRETTALAFSVAKGLTATCIHRLIEQLNGATLEVGG